MRGILWKWLLFLGFIFWTALYVNDYYRRNLEQQDYLRAKYLENEIDKSNVLLPQKKVPPALTFWKTLSMILSVTALIYIKRSSTIKNCSGTNLTLPYPVPELDKFTSPPRSVNKTSVFRACIRDIKAIQKKQLLTDLYCGEPKKPQPQPKKPIRNIKVGVDIVQKKLESLEKTVANLKQRRTLNNVTSNTPSGIVSGSPEFRKFLSTCQTLHTPTATPESLTQISIVSSQLSDSSNVPGSDLVSASTTSEISFDKSIFHVSEIFNSVDLSISDKSSKISDVKDDLNNVKSDLKNIKPELKSVNSNLRVVKHNLKDVKPDLKAVKSDLKNIKLDLKNMKPDLKNIKPDLKNVNSNLRDIKPSLRDIKQSLKAVKSPLRDIKPDVKYVKPDLKYVKSNLKNVKSDLKTAKPDLSELKPTVITVKKDTIPNISTQNEDDSSWSTISGNPSGSLLSNQAPEVVIPASLESQVLPKAITEIFPLKQTFSKSSKTSVNSKISANSENSQQFLDDLSVPGSNLVSSGNTSVSSSTLMSNSINNMSSVILGSSCMSFDDDILVNSLD